MKTTSAVQRDILKIMEALGLEKKANESMSSAQSGFGDEFVPTDLAEAVVAKVRDKSRVFSKIPAGNIWEMTSNPFEIPVEGADPTFYNTAEQTDVAGTAVTTSKAATAKKTITAKKLSASVYFTGELDDDAKIAGGIRNYVESKLSAAYAELLDKMLINGDTTTAGTGNVNSDDGAPTAGTYYLAMDGLIKHALDESNDVNCGTLDSGDFTAVRKELGRHGQNPEELLCIMNLETYYKTLGLSQIETMEKFGSSATITNGVLSAIYGIPVVANGDFGLAEADGKQSVTGSNNTLGRFLIVWLPGILFGWKRKMRINLEYLPRTDQFVLTAHTRFGFDMAAADQVGLGRNITV